MIKYVAGIDAGTTGLKTIIFDLQGRAIGKDYEEYPCITPRVGWVSRMCIAFGMHYAIQ